MQEDHDDTRLRFHRTLTTPLLPRPVFSENSECNYNATGKLTRPRPELLPVSGTVPEERTFTVYLGDIPADVALASVRLNGEELTAPFTDTSRRTVTNDVHPNNTHCYTLKVPFDDPAVSEQVKSEFLCLSQTSGFVFTQNLGPAWLIRIDIFCFLVLQRRCSYATKAGHQLHTDRCA